VKDIFSQKKLMKITAEHEYNEAILYYASATQNFNHADPEFYDIAMEEMMLAKQLADLKYRKLKLIQSHEK